MKAKRHIRKAKSMLEIDANIRKFQVSLGQMHTERCLKLVIDKYKTLNCGRQTYRYTLKDTNDIPTVLVIKDRT